MIRTSSAFAPFEKVSAWRKMAIATWDTPSAASIYGWIDVDATKLSAYLERVRRETGRRVTVTHLVGKAAALAFAEHPDANAVLSRGVPRRRKTVDVFFSVAVEGGKGLAGAKIGEVDTKSVAEIAEALSDEVDRIRRRADTDIQRSQSLLGRLPTRVTATLLRAVSAATFDLELDLGSLGIPTDPFGTVIVTNIGVLGAERGLAPLIPHGRSAAILTVGEIREGVLPVAGRPEVRPVLTIGGTFDHRVVDGYHLGKISQRLAAVLSDPEAALGDALMGRDGASAQGLEKRSMQGTSTRLGSPSSADGPSPS